jgi:hypothetical protein
VISEETITLTDADVSGGVNVEESANWITSGDGLAKKINILPVFGNGGDEIKLYLKINGSYGDAITTLFDNYPITIENLFIEQVKISSNDTTDGQEIFTIITYH